MRFRPCLSAYGRPVRREKMKYNRLVIMLPCESLESFQLERREEDAQELLSGWSALWHPALLSAAQALPCWLPPSTPPPDPAGNLVIVPNCVAPLLPEGWVAEAEAAGACVLRGLAQRSQILDIALERLETAAAEYDPEITADFLALGYCHFVVELLARKAYYMSHLDESGLQSAVLSAAEAATRGDLQAAKNRLRTAFDRLHDAREYAYSYPATVNLIDITLLASGMFEEGFRAELVEQSPKNLLVSAEVLDKAAGDDPALLELLRAAIGEGRVEVIGGHWREGPAPLLPPEALRADVLRGLAAYRRLLGEPPTCFARRRFGLTPAMPQILKHLGFRGALHFTLNDGRFPTDKGAWQWEGLDGSSLAALGQIPLDAGRAAPFLRLPELLGDEMRTSSSPVMVFAHWPGKAACWYHDLRRIAAYGPVLGAFCTVSKYLSEAELGMRHRRHSADAYRAPYLRQDVAAGRRDALSRWVRYYRLHTIFDACQAEETMTACLRNFVGQDAQPHLPPPCKDTAQLAEAVEKVLEADAAETESLAAELQERMHLRLAEFGRLLGRKKDDEQRGLLIVNPFSFSRQVAVALQPDGREALVDVPAMGFSWVNPQVPAAPLPETKKRSRLFWRRNKSAPPLGDGTVLRNEFCEVHFDPVTGGIRALFDYQHRHPRLAQQVALRLPRVRPADAEENYSLMAADELKVTSSGPELGEMLSTGRLVDREGRRVARFRQITRLRRGSRIVELLLELEIERPPAPNPWESYYAMRFVWPDETTTVFRAVNMAVLPTEAEHIESPLFVELRRDEERTTVLSGGLPYYCRRGMRKLDTLLVVSGESERKFRLGLGIDLPNPLSAALSFIAPTMILPDRQQPPMPNGWLFHLDRRNVIATYWTPIPRSQASETGEGTVGFRVRLLETAGRETRLSLRCFRNVKAARILNPGEAATELSTKDDRIEIPLKPYQWAEVEAWLS